jgi:hypothetical protein
MADMDMERRRPNRGARQPARVRDLVEDLASRGHTPSAIRQEVLDVFGEPITPSLRTVREMAKAVHTRDVTGPWSPAADTTGVPEVILAVLAAVLAETAGSDSTNFAPGPAMPAGPIRSITRAEAAIIANVERATPGLPAFELWRIARLYLARAARDEPTDDLDGFLAFQPWRGNAEEGWRAYSLAVHFRWVREAPGYLVGSIYRAHQTGGVPPLTSAEWIFTGPSSAFDDLVQRVGESEAEVSAWRLVRDWINRPDRRQRERLSNSGGNSE